MTSEITVPNQIVRMTTRAFHGMDARETIATWVEGNREKVDEIVLKFVTLLKEIETVDITDPRVKKFAPGIVALRERLKEAKVELPDIEYFTGHDSAVDYANGIRQAKEAVFLGQTNKRKKLAGEEVSEDDRMLAIGTTSLVMKDLEVHTASIAGHLFERTVMQYLVRKGVFTKEELTKDMILHPISELLKIKYTRNEETPLMEVYTHPDLGWSSEKSFAEFSFNWVTFGV